MALNENSGWWREAIGPSLKNASVNNSSMDWVGKNKNMSLTKGGDSIGAKFFMSNIYVPSHQN